METPECVLSPTTNCPLQALTVPIALSLSPSNPAGGSVSSVALLLKLSLSGTGRGKAQTFQRDIRVPNNQPASPPLNGVFWA